MRNSGINISLSFATLVGAGVAFAALALASRAREQRVQVPDSVNSGRTGARVRRRYRRQPNWMQQ